MKAKKFKNRKTQHSIGEANSRIRAELEFQRMSKTEKSGRGFIGPHYVVVALFFLFIVDKGVET